MVARSVSALGDYLRARREQVRPEDVGLARGRSAACCGFAPRGAGYPGRHQLRILPAARAGPCHTSIRSSRRCTCEGAATRREGHRVPAPAGHHDQRPSRARDCRYRRPWHGGANRPVAHASSCRQQMPGCLGGKSRCPCAVPGLCSRRNFLCWQLLDPAARDFYVDWHEATDVVVSALREAAGSDPDDPRLGSLVDELSTASERFRELWARADIGYPTNVAHMRHPLVGDLYLHRNKLTIPHSGGQQMLIFRAESGSESAQALERLRSLSTDHGHSSGPL